MRGLRTPFGRVNRFDARPSPALAYVIGARLGDAYIYRHNRGNTHVYRIELTVNDYEFAEETGRNLAELLGRTKPYRPRWNKSNHRWRIRCGSVLLYGFLQEPWEKVRPYIEHCTDCIIAFLRGFFDSEGSITGKVLRVYNTNRRVLSYVKHLLKHNFSIEATGPHRSRKKGRRFRSPTSGKVYKTRKPDYYLYVRASSLSLFFQHIGFRISRKQHRFVKTVQKLVSPPSPVLLSRAN